ncbi:MAG: hypothetical protein HC836_41230 [Richelia sp. RM2_1_2]|nr:hypothetical protein [Richelia sp. RM2_1_2]
MNQEIKQKWIVALRSGNYKQGRELLCIVNEKKEEEYCCLGVLCEIAAKENIVEKTKFLDCDFFRYGISGYVLSTEVMSWAAIDSSLAELPANLCFHKDGGIISCNHNSKPINLGVLNDAYNLTFDEIADVIEKYL